jgi:hypothetical protein
MRKLSYLFLVLGGLTPIVTGWVIDRVSRQYQARTGFPPDGIGLFSYIALGILVTFTLWLLAAIFAARAYQLQGKPRSWIRSIEVTLICALPIALTGITYFVVLGR